MGHRSFQTHILKRSGDVHENVGPPFFGTITGHSIRIGHLKGIMIRCDLYNQLQKYYSFRLVLKRKEGNEIP